MQDNTSSAVYIVNYTQSTLETDYMALGGHRLTVVGRDIYKYGMTVLFVLGSIVNVLILLVVFKTPLRQSNVSLYLVALAIFDQLTILIAVFGSHVLRSYTGFDYIRYNRWLCKSAYFTIFTCAQSSFYFVVAMSAERALAVFRPLQFKKFYTTKRTKIIIAGIVVFFCMKNLHMFWSSGALYRDVKVGNATTKVVISECDLVDGPLLKFNLKVRPWIDCGITFLACFIIVLSDAIIIATMTRTTILNKKTTTAPNTDTSQKSPTYMIAMLVSTSMTFVCLTLPLQIISTIYPTNSNDGGHHFAVLAPFLWSFGLLLSYMNHGINFYVYFLSSREFRQYLKIVLKCCDTSGLKRKSHSRSTEHTNSRV